MVSFNPVTNNFVGDINVLMIMTTMMTRMAKEYVLDCCHLGKRATLQKCKDMQCRIFIFSWWRWWWWKDAAMQRWSVKSGKKSAKTKLFWSFSLKGGGGPLFPNVYVRILTKSEHFCKNQKCSLGPKTQNKPSQKSRIFFLTGSLIDMGNWSALALFWFCTSWTNYS